LRDPDFDSDEYIDYYTDGNRHGNCVGNTDRFADV
jgi:hypothetical protein